MLHRIRPWRAALFGSVVAGTAFSLAGVGMAGTAGTHPQGAGSAPARVQRLRARPQQEPDE